VTADMMARLAPYLCTTDTAAMVRINVNTLTPDDGPLLAMLAPGQLSLERARRIITARPAEGWATTTEFQAVPAVAQLLPAMNAAAQSAFDVKTDLFRLDIRVDEAGFLVTANSLIRIEGERATVLSRASRPFAAGPPATANAEPPR
ncbi:MAG: type II secretion system protein GspK, partial [Pseudomonadota bacterium]